MPRRAVGRLARFLHGSFLFSLGVQAAIGGSQLLAAVVLQVAERTGWLKTIAQVTGHELATRTPDPMAASLLRVIHDFSVSRETFWSIYLMGHGILNLAVVAALLARKPWAHPAAMIVLAGFVAYQLDRWQLTHAPVLLLLSAFDLAVIGLVWREWRVTRATE